MHPHRGAEIGLRFAQNDSFQAFFRSLKSPDGFFSRALQPQAASRDALPSCGFALDEIELKSCSPELELELATEGSDDPFFLFGRQAAVKQA
jgi:hypothetical protein